jgi:hypothetical protein
MTDATESILATEPIWSRRTAAAGATLAVLVVLADILFFSHEPGISLAIFVLALVVGVLALRPAKLRAPRTLLLTAVAVLAALPLAESQNLLWFPMAIGAVSLLALAAAGLLPRYEDWPGALTRFNVLAPFRLLGDGLSLIGEAGRQKAGHRVLRGALVWVVPVVCTGVFLALLATANPVIEQALRAIRLDELLKLLDPLRICIWGFFAALSWPLLSPRLLAWTPALPVQGPMQPRPESLVFGFAAIRNSLVVFNALFAVQTVSDLIYLWGGVRLPDGLSYADYAHHAAYPLIVTAVLAGAFVLAAMRQGGPGQSSPLIRGLVYLWIGQNVWLVISAILRLKLYVETYMLSELRIAAGIWMALVAVGLLLILARIIFARSNKWLVTANLTSLSLTLFAVSFVDFPATISWFNVLHSAEMGQSEQPVDFYYLGDLGPGVIPAVDYLLAHQTRGESGKLKDLEIMRENMALLVERAEDWQSWTWRQQRLRFYLLEHPYAVGRPDATH